MGMDWNGEEVLKLSAAEGTRRLTRAVIVLSRHAKQQLSMPRRRKISGTTGKVVGAFTSKPGEFPRKVTGWFRKDVGWAIMSATTARWGTNVPYGKWLELGTRKMRPRPWMTLTNQRKAFTVRQIMETGESILE